MYSKIKLLDDIMKSSALISESSCFRGAFCGSTRRFQGASWCEFPEGHNFAISVANQLGVNVFVKTFAFESDFKDFCDKCTHLETVGFFSASFKAARVNSIANFAKTFFLPITTMYVKNPTPLTYLLTIIWDLGTLVFRFLTLPYRFYEYRHATPSTLLEELKKNGVNMDAEPYLDVHIYFQRILVAGKNSFRFLNGMNMGIMNVGERIFFERPFEEERFEYRSCGRIRDYDIPRQVSQPERQVSTQHPNPSTSPEIQARMNELSFCPPTRTEACTFFNLPPDFTQEQLGKQYKQTSLRYHPDKIKTEDADGICMRWVNACRDALKT